MLIQDICLSGNRCRLSTLQGEHVITKGGMVLPKVDVAYLDL